MKSNHRTVAMYLPEDLIQEIREYGRERMPGAFDERGRGFSGVVRQLILFGLQAEEERLSAPSVSLDRVDSSFPGGRRTARDAQSVPERRGI